MHEIKVGYRIWVVFSVSLCSFYVYRQSRCTNLRVFLCSWMWRRHLKYPQNILSGKCPTKRMKVKPTMTTKTFQSLRRTKTLKIKVRVPESTRIYTRNLYFSYILISMRPRFFRSAMITYFRFKEIILRGSWTNSTSRRVFLSQHEDPTCKIIIFFRIGLWFKRFDSSIIYFLLPPPPPSNMGEWRWKHFSVDIAFYRVCSICDISFHVILSYFRYFYWFSACAFLGIYFYSSSIRKSSVVFWRECVFHSSTFFRLTARYYPYLFFNAKWKSQVFRYSAVLRIYFTIVGRFPFNRSAKFILKVICDKTVKVKITIFLCFDVVSVIVFSRSRCTFSIFIVY